MTIRSPKPPILRSRRGIILLLVLVASLFAVLYVGVGATAFLRTAQQDDPPIPSGAGAAPDADGGAPTDDGASPAPQ